jgi:hypothetical protein
MEIFRAAREREARMKTIMMLAKPLAAAIESLCDDGPLQPIATGRHMYLREVAEPMQEAADMFAEPICTTLGNNPDLLYVFVPGGTVEDYYEAVQYGGRFFQTAE